jgi:hypothetical protein
LIFLVVARGAQGRKAGADQHMATGAGAGALAGVFDFHAMLEQSRAADGKPAGGNFTSALP